MFVLNLVSLLPSDLLDDARFSDERCWKINIDNTGTRFVYVAHLVLWLCVICLEVCKNRVLRRIFENLCCLEVCKNRVLRRIFENLCYLPSTWLQQDDDEIDVVKSIVIGTILLPRWVNQEELFIQKERVVNVLREVSKVYKIVFGDLQGRALVLKLKLSGCVLNWTHSGKLLMMVSCKYGNFWDAWNFVSLSSACVAELVFSNDFNEFKNVGISWQFGCFWSPLFNCSDARQTYKNTYLADSMDLKLSGLRFHVTFLCTTVI